MNSMTDFMDRLRADHPAGSPDTAEYECPKCKDTGYIIEEGQNGYSYARDCECVAIKQARLMMKRSGISEEFQKKTFDNFKTRNNEQLAVAKSKAMKYVEEFEKIEHDRYNSIMFCGQVGAGKTHLGTAICGELMKKSIAVVYMAYRNAVTKIKQNLIDEKTYEKQLNQYSCARVLYIDDLLKGKLTETDINIMYEIINYRYMNNLPIIISTEKAPRDLLIFDEAIGSRIWEMCRGNTIQLKGRELNYRLS